MLNLSVDRIYSTVAFSIALLKEFSLFGFPNKRVLATIFNCSQNTCIYCSYFVNESLSLKIKIWRNGEKNEMFFQYHYCCCKSDRFSLKSYVYIYAFLDDSTQFLII